MDNKPLTLLILNGKGAGNDDLREAITTLREEGFDIAVRVTFEKGDGDRYVKEAIALQAATVVAGGGDGTINEIATALASSEADHRPVLGILPLVPPTILPPASASRKRWNRHCDWRFRAKPVPSIWPG